MMKNSWITTSNIVCFYLMPPNNFSIPLFFSVWTEILMKILSLVGEKSTFTSSTKEGNPPIAMKVRSAVVYIITSHLACKIGQQINSGGI
jgi:hypothetical protein